MSRQSTVVVLALLFVVSGATGLVYQITWFKYLSYFFGNTTYAQTVVLATFMGGLAIGAWVLGKRADTTRFPLLQYAYLETGIGLYGLACPYVISYGRDVFLSVAQSTGLPSDHAMILFGKFLASAVILLPPTVLMGGTLPVLVRGIARDLDDSGRTLAALYFLNSLGAVLGSLVGGVFLIPGIGLRTTITVAAGVNLLIAAIALLIGRAEAVQAGQNTAPAQPEETAHPRAVSPAILVAGLSGAASMIYEISWVRLLAPVLGSSTYSFTVMLLAFIGGIAGGSWMASLVLRRRPHLPVLLAWSQAGIVVSLLVTLPLYSRVPFMLVTFGQMLQRSDATYPLFLSLEFLLCFLLMVIPTIFLGLSLPIATRIASRDMSRLGRSIGSVFAVNTLGTVLGALTAGLVLVPLLGIRMTFFAGIALNAAGSMIMVFASEGSGRKVRIGLATVLCAAAVLCVTTLGDWTRHIMLSGVFRMVNKSVAVPSDFASFSGIFSRDSILFYDEGVSACVAVVQRSIPPHERVLVVNGKPDASSGADLASQVLVGQMGMLLHPHPDTVLVIGLGSGVSLGSVLTHDISHADCAEISPEVVRASHLFDDVNGRPLDDPRTRLTVDDALSFLRVSGARYDVIVNEPTNPWIAGVGNLFTVDFLRECVRHLKEDGVMVQWFHTYEMDDETLSLAIRTFHHVFPHATVWQPVIGDVIIVGTTTPVSGVPERLGNKLGMPHVRDDLHRIAIDDIPSLLSLQMISPGEVGDYAGAGGLNTEDRPLLEYRAPRSFYVNGGTPVFNTFDARLFKHPGRLYMADYVADHPLTDDDLLRLARLHVTPIAEYRIGREALRDYLNRHPADTTAVARAVFASTLVARDDEALELLEQLTRLKPRDARTLWTYAWRRYTREAGRITWLRSPLQPPTDSLLLRAITLGGDTLDQPMILLGSVYLDEGRFAEAAHWYRRALEVRERYISVSDVTQDNLLLTLSRSLYLGGDTALAASYAAQAYLQNPSNTRALEFLGVVRRQVEGRGFTRN